MTRSHAARQLTSTKLAFSAVFHAACHLGTCHLVGIAGLHQADTTTFTDVREIALKGCEKPYSLPL